MKVAIIHYWLTKRRGGERVLEEICQLFPNADIYTHVVDRKSLSESLLKHNIYTTFIARLPFARKLYQLYLPFMPLALEELDLTGYDLVISSESGPAKGVITDTHTKHVCYCHTPMRYIWNMYPAYKRDAGVISQYIIPFLFHYMRQWDFCSAARVDYFIANSSAVAARIKKYYRRHSEVIAPPVDTERFRTTETVDDGFYLCCGELVEYKKVDLAIQAFNKMGKKLVVIGGGQKLTEARRIAGPTVSILGWQSEEVLMDHYSRCSALIFPGEEDFGLVPVEAMAAGKPVIAYERGGIRDTVLDRVTGILYKQQTVAGLMSAVEDFEKTRDTFSRQTIMNHAEKFASAAFRQKFSDFIGQVLLRDDIKSQEL